MKRLLFLIVMLVVLMSPTAYADTLYLAVNTGAGDNFGYIGQMNGHQFVLSGGVHPFFFGNDGYAPGSTLGGQTELFLYSSTIWVSGVPLEFFFPFPSCSLFMSTFTLPLNGEGLTVPVDISFTAMGINPDTGQSINLGGYAKGSISLYFANGRYYPTDFVPATVPELGTLGFVSTGLMGVVVAVRRALSVRGSSRLRCPSLSARKDHVL